MLAIVQNGVSAKHRQERITRVMLIDRTLAVIESSLLQLTISTLLLPLSLPRSVRLSALLLTARAGRALRPTHFCCTDTNANSQHLSGNKADGRYLPENKADSQHLPGNKLRQAFHTLADSQHTLATKVSHVRCLC